MTHKNSNSTKCTFQFHKLEKSFCVQQRNDQLPIWSRLKHFNAQGQARGTILTSADGYDIEIAQRLWSVWGTLSPHAICFQLSQRGKQFLACNVMALMAAASYPLENWNSQLLNEIIISGDRYYRESFAKINKCDYEFSLEDLSTECKLCKLRFKVHLEHVAYGKLYAIPTRTQMNLSNALIYFFEHFNNGVLQCRQHSLAFGRSKYARRNDAVYFMFDCQSRDEPIFTKGQGAAYLLKMKTLQDLLYCIVKTLNVSSANVLFHLHKVEMAYEN